MLILILVLTNIAYSEHHSETQSLLNSLDKKLDNAQIKLKENKITELRNILWEDVDPKIKIMIDNIENDIENIKYVNNYDFPEFNLSHGDVKRGMDLFERVKIDSDYAINNMDFQEKIYETREVIKKLRITTQLIPEVEVDNKKINQEFELEEEIIETFSIKIKDVDTYKDVKDMNITYINKIFDFKIDQTNYKFVNKDESNITKTITEINKKIYPVNQVRNVKIYEVFCEDINISDVSFTTPHSYQFEKNSVLIYEGNMYENSVTPINYISKINSSDELSMTLIVVEVPKTKSEIDDEVIDNNKPTIEEDNNDFNKEYTIEEKLNYFPYILLGALTMILFVLILYNVLTKNKTALELEQFRKKINNLKANKK